MKRVRIFKIEYWKSIKDVLKGSGKIFKINIENQLKMFEKGPAAAEQRPDAEPGRPKTTAALSLTNAVQFSNAFGWIFKCICLNFLHVFVKTLEQSEA